MKHLVEQFGEAALEVVIGGLMMVILIVIVKNMLFY